MTYDPLLQSVLGAMVLATAVFTWHQGRSSARRTRQGVEFARRYLATIEQRFVPMLGARYRRNANVAAVSLLLMGGLIIVIPAGDLETPFNSAPVLVLGSVFASLHFAWTAAQPLNLAGDAARTARVRRVNVNDLVPPWLRLTCWGFIVALSAMLVLVIARTSDWATASLISAVTCLLLGMSLLGTELTAQWLVRQPESATDSAQLYCQDAFRAEALSEAYQSSAFAAGLAMMVLWPVAFGMPFWVGLLPIASALVLVVIARRSDRLRCRRRLWGWLEPDEVVRPGSTLVPR